MVQVYPKPHDSSRWHDHNVRVAVTIALARGLEDVQSVADLSCGDGRIARGVREDAILGDFAPGYPITGALEITVPQLPGVDLYVASETLEHLDDPQAFLASVRPKAKYLCLTTPVEAWDEQNIEHYHAWDQEYVESMMVAAGWEPFVYNALDMRRGWSPYCFGMWLCR